MSDAAIAKNFLLGKDNLSVVRNKESIKFFMRYFKENKEECRNFLREIETYVCELADKKKRTTRYWHFFNNPYGDSVMLLEVRHDANVMTSIYGRWEYLRNFADLKEEK